MKKNFYVINALLFCVCLGMMSGCAEKPAFTATDITGANIGATYWSLQDAQGKTQSIDRFKGQVVAIFFGFTRCPDVCPTTLVDFSRALKLMGADAAKVQVLFVTLDPERDTFPALQDYTAAFDPRFVSLRGDVSATKAAADAFKVFYAKNMATDKAPLNYTLDHTAASYVFDASGHIRLYMRYGQTAETIAKDLQLLIQ
jgi:protein SCO1